MKTTFLFFAMLIFVTAHSQNIFQKTYNAFGLLSCLSVIQENDSGYTFLLSKDYSLSSTNITRTDKRGSVIWSKSYAGAFNISNKMIKTLDDGYLISARSLPITNLYYHQLMKLDNSATPVWTKRYYDGTFNQGSVIETSDSGLILYGRSDNRLYLIKTDEMGDTIWTRLYSNSNGNNITSVAETADHGFIVSGTYASGIHYQSFLFKTGSTGNIEWSKNFDSSFPPYLKKVIQTPDGGFLSSGIVWDTSTIERSILLKTDSVGNLTWNKLYTGLSAGQIKKTKTSDYFLFGETNQRDTADFALLKINALGDSIWTWSYGLDSLRGEYMDDAIQTSDDGFILTGRSTFANPGAVYVVKTDANGETPCNIFPLNISISSATFTLSNIAFTVNSGFNYNSFVDTMSVDQVVDSLACGSFTGIDEATEYSWLTAFPNPAYGSITISLNGPYEFHSPRLMVYDVLGKLVMYISSETLKNKKQIVVDTADLSQGGYYIVLVSDNKIAGIEKFIKLKD